MGAEQSGHQGAVPSSGADHDGALLDPYVLNASPLVTAMSLLVFAVLPRCQPVAYWRRDGGWRVRRGGCTGFCRKEPVFDKMRGNRSCTLSERVSRAKKLALFDAVPACAPPVCKKTPKILPQVGGRC